MRDDFIGALILAVAVFGCSESNKAADGGSSGNADAGISGSGGSDGGVGARGGSGGSGGGSACQPACGVGRECCGTDCVNPANDPRNCGECGTPCNASSLCTAGQCISRPCMAACEGGTTCCGSECCSPGQLCCDPQGPIDVGPRCVEPDDRGTCPRGCAPLCECAAPETPIATPQGDRPIATLQMGDRVFSIDRGVLRAVPILRTNSISVANHQVVRLTLASGVVLQISAGHPTADGRSFGQLHAGDALDGVVITSAELVPYPHDATYDILPDSDTGSYFAGGVLVGSTLAVTAIASDAPTAPYTPSRLARQ